MDISFSWEVLLVAVPAASGLFFIAHNHPPTFLEIAPKLYIVLIAVFLLSVMWNLAMTIAGGAVARATYSSFSLTEEEASDLEIQGEIKTLFESYSNQVPQISDEDRRYLIEILAHSMSSKVRDAVRTRTDQIRTDVRLSVDHLNVRPMFALFIYFFVMAMYLGFLMYFVHSVEKHKMPKESNDD